MAALFQEYMRKKALPRSDPRSKPFPSSWSQLSLPAQTRLGSANPGAQRRGAQACPPGLRDWAGAAPPVPTQLPRAAAKSYYFVG